MCFRSHEPQDLCVVCYQGGACWYAIAGPRLPVERARLSSSEGVGGWELWFLSPQHLPYWTVSGGGTEEIYQSRLRARARALAHARGNDA
jgi:hypothetical protein